MALHPPSSSSSPSVRWSGGPGRRAEAGAGGAAAGGNGGDGEVDCGAVADAQHTSSRFATFSPFDAEKVIKAERKERSRAWRPGVLTLNRISVDERLSAVQFFAPRRFWAERSLSIHGAWRRILGTAISSNGPGASKPKRQPGTTTTANPFRPKTRKSNSQSPAERQKQISCDRMGAMRLTRTGFMGFGD